MQSQGTDEQQQHASSSTAQVTPTRPKQQRVLVLIGLVGSGKSTFAKALRSHEGNNFVRASQDVLGSRQAVESLVLRSLEQGANVCIDRTNVDASQRANWLRLAHQYQERKQGEVQVIVEAVVFDTPVEECRRRLMARTDHETITSPEVAQKVLHTFAGQFRPPTASEGFHCVAYIKPHQLPADPSPEGVQAVLDAIAATPRAFEGGTRGSSIPAGSGGSRGRGRGRGHHSWGALQRGRGGGEGGRGRGSSRGAVPWRAQGGQPADYGSLPPRPYGTQPYPTPTTGAAGASYSQRAAAPTSHALPPRLPPHSAPYPGPPPPRPPTLHNDGFEIVDRN